MRLPLTLGQQGLWYLSQTGDTMSAAYNIVMAYELSGRVEIPLLARSLWHLLDRHPVLASRVVQDDDGALAFEVPDPDRRRRLIDDHLVSTTGDLSTIALEESGRPFQFESGPLLRITEVLQGDGGRGLVFAFAHLAFDGASLPCFMEQLSALYDSLARGEPPPLLPATLSAEDAVLRERLYLEGPDGQNALAATRERLGGVPGHLPLPLSIAPAGAGVAPRAGVLTLRLEETRAAAIRSFCASRRLSPTSLLLLAYQVTLWHFSGQQDCGIAMPINARDTEAAQATIGYLSNVAVVRTRLDPGASLSQALDQTAGALLDVLETASVPFPAIVRVLKKSGSDLQGALTQLSYNYQEAAAQPPHLGEAELSLVAAPVRFAKNQLKLDVTASAAGFKCEFVFAEDELDRTIVEAMAAHFEAVVDEIVRAPDLRLRELLPTAGLATPQAASRAWAGMPGEPTSGRLLHQFFEEQAALTPDAIALVMGERRLCYADLNARANRLAHRLRECGVRPDHLVALCSPRDIDLIVGLLGILKAGGAYLPLDPGYPEERLSYMLRDSGASVLVVGLSPVADRLAGLVPRTVHLNEHGQSDVQWDDRNLAPGAMSPDRLAYCLYTSGSTGRPKGVALTHRNAANFLTWVARQFSGDVMRRVAFTTSVCFDLSVFEIFGTLQAGGTVVIFENALALMEVAPTAGLTLVNTVPSSIWALAQADALPRGLLGVSLCGEPLHRPVVERIHAQLAGVKVYNLYGPTEYTTYTTVSEIPSAPAAIVPLGEPILNTSLHILNGDLQELPTGVVGELFIAGAGLARGYLHRPDATAERFIPDPSGPPGARMYRTGDLVRRRLDGQLEFMGRNDHQVKIRGHRIELGEIETTLRRCDEVVDAVVLAVASDKGDRCLVAYVVMHPGREIAFEDLEARIRIDLPDYMVPQHWMSLPALPLTPNGKADRQALPAPVLGGSHGGPAYEAPRTAAEAVLAEIWAAVLGLERVGVRDNFFVLGGHSLMATQVVSRARQAGLHGVSMRTLFDAPTVEAMALSAAPREDGPGEDEDDLVAIPRHF